MRERGGMFGVGQIQRSLSPWYVEWHLLKLQWEVIRERTTISKSDGDFVKVTHPNPSVSL